MANSAENRSIDAHNPPTTSNLESHPHRRKPPELSAPSCDSLAPRKQKRHRQKPMAFKQIRSGWASAPDMQTGLLVPIVATTHFLPGSYTWLYGLCVGALGYQVGLELSGVLGWALVWRTVKEAVRTPAMLLGCCCCSPSGTAIANHYKSLLASPPPYYYHIPQQTITGSELREQNL